jgi:hypothetical protein
MKRFTIFIIFAISLQGISFCQFPYATPNITKGSVICTYTTEYKETDEKHKVIVKSIEKVQFSTQLLLNFAYTADELPGYKKKIESWGRLPLIVSANNFVRTRDKDEPVTSRVPRFPTSISCQSDGWTIDPCNKNTDELVHSSHTEGKGQMRDPLRGVILSLEGLKNDTGFYMVKISPVGGWGNIKDIIIKSKVYEPDENDPDQECKWQNVDGELYYTETGPSLTSVFESGTDLDTGYTGTNGRYRRVEDRLDTEGTIGTSNYDFFKIDTGSIFTYLRDLPPLKQFIMPGRLHTVSVLRTATGESTSEFTETSTLTLIFGEIKNELILSTQNEDDYHDWIPYRKDEDGYMPLQVKAELKSEDPEPKDTIHFYLPFVSHFTGFCTNYPVLDKNLKPDRYADIRFAKDQSDPNIVYIDTFNVKTNKKVASAVVDIECYDFGGYARLEARTSIKNAEGHSKYDNDKTFLILPEDDNNNMAADKWEKDVGVFEKKLGEKDDSDEFPKDQKDEGDGYTLFEEYRGFYADKDFCKDDKNIVRKGKFLRTDPNWKDIFIYDATKKAFETQFAPSNPADLNWHMVGDDQIKHISDNIINARLQKESKDNKGNYIYPEALLSYLIDNDHRWMNYNTPVDLRLDKHFGLFLFYSKGLEGTNYAGSVTYSGDYKSYVKKSQFTEIQEYAPYENFIITGCPTLLYCSNAPNCAWHDFYRGPKSPKVCPSCGSILKERKVCNESQLKQIAKLTYEGAIIHEIGHNIMGPDHHSHGATKFVDEDGIEHFITGSSVATLLLNDSEKQAAMDKLAECGVPTCAMIYNLSRPEEYLNGSLLNTRTNRYCHKNETYIDDFKSVQPADNCFGKITVK